MTPSYFLLLSLLLICKEQAVVFEYLPRWSLKLLISAFICSTKLLLLPLTQINIDWFGSVKLKILLIPIIVLVIALFILHVHIVIVCMLCLLFTIQTVHDLKRGNFGKNLLGYVKLLFIDWIPENVHQLEVLVVCESVKLTGSRYQIVHEFQNFDLRTLASDIYQAAHNFVVI